MLILKRRLLCQGYGHALVKAFQKRDYRSFKAALGHVENVSPQLMTNIKSFIKNRHLIKNMTTSRLLNDPVEGVNRKIKHIKIEKKKPIRK